MDENKDKLWVAKFNGARGTWHAVEGSGAAGEEPHDVGKVKKDWKCHHCQFNSPASGVTLFKIVSEKRDLFSLVCWQCESTAALMFDPEVAKLMGTNR